MTRCKDCRFFAVHLSRVSALKSAAGVGECRRNAPRGPVVIGWSHGGEPVAVHSAVVNPFPFVPDDDWCGEFQPMELAR
jgi:hypothetical protein